MFSFGFSPTSRPFRNFDLGHHHDPEKLQLQESGIKSQSKSHSLHESHALMKRFIKVLSPEIIAVPGTRISICSCCGLHPCPRAHHPKFSRQARQYLLKLRLALLSARISIRNRGQGYRRDSFLLTHTERKVTAGNATLSFSHSRHASWIKNPWRKLHHVFYEPGISSIVLAST